MEDPCYTCLVRSCCTKYCGVKCKYNQNVKKLYKQNKNKHLFEKAVDDLIKLVHKEHPNFKPILKDDVKRCILNLP